MDNRLPIENKTPPARLPAAPTSPPEEPAPEREPTRELTQAELQAQLDGRAEAIKARLDVLQDEVMTSGEALKEAVTRNPFVAVGGTIAAGLVVGLLFGGRKKKQPPEHAAHRALLDGYIAGISDEVRRHVRKGADADEAVAAALRDRAPLIVYAPEAEYNRPGFFRDFLDFTLKTALGFAVKAAADYLSSKVDLVTWEEQFTMEDTHEGTKTTVKHKVTEKGDAES